MTLLRRDCKDAIAVSRGCWNRTCQTSQDDLPTEGFAGKGEDPFDHVVHDIRREAGRIFGGPLMERERDLAEIDNFSVVLAVS